jgi:hypothetical protein
MSGGTAIACACKEIVMGKQSSIGPIDPQIGGVPAQGIIEEFEEAIESVKRAPATWPVWQAIIGKYHPTLIGECRKAIDLAGEIAKKWLADWMFAGRSGAADTAGRIVDRLNSHADTKVHARHIHADEAKALGLEITMLEDDDDLQDLVLTVHHAYMQTLFSSTAAKLIENHEGHTMEPVAKRSFATPTELIGYAPEQSQPRFARMAEWRGAGVNQGFARGSMVFNM